MFAALDAKDPDARVGDGLVSLADHPDVAERAIIGVADSLRGRDHDVPSTIDDPAIVHELAEI